MSTKKQMNRLSVLLFLVAVTQQQENMYNHFVAVLVFFNVFCLRWYRIEAIF